MRKIVIAVMLVIGFVLAGGVLASPAQATRGPVDERLHLLSETLPPLLAGQHGWVHTDWLSTTEACDVQVTASGPGVTIAYPADTGSYSSLSGGSSIAVGEMDYAALHVSVDPSAHGVIPLTLTVSYTKTRSPGSGACSGVRTTSVEQASLPVVLCSGPPFDQRTAAVTVDRATPSWVHLYFHGCAPGLDDFRIVLAPPAGLEVAYPSERSSSGLAKVHALEVGSDDYTAVHLDASALPVGTVRVPVLISWTGGTAEAVVAVTVTEAPTH